MNTVQKIIKYLALALAISIIAGIAVGVLQLAGLLVNIDRSEASSEPPIIQTIGEDVTALDMDLKGIDLEIRRGTAFTVETDSSSISIKLQGSKLVIKENNSWLQKNTGTLWITLPEGFAFHEVEIDAGAGEMKATALTAKELDLSLGAGKVTFTDLIVSEKAEIDGGAGSIQIQGGTVQNLDLDMGVGELNLTAVLTGKNQIDCGVGKVSLVLIHPETYSIRLDKGIGDATYCDEPMESGTVYGTGESWVEIDGGVGSISVDLAEVGIKD